MNYLTPLVPFLIKIVRLILYKMKISRNLSLNNPHTTKAIIKVQLLDFEV